ncbi:MAG: site-specific integrase, partial [Bacteroides xylanisolvens]
YKAYPETRTPQPRGQNTINDIFVKLRTFYLWAIDTDKTANNPFKNFKIEECVYGSPYYITLDERNALYNLDLSSHPQLAIQRDIFVFQSVIGCRVGDLYSFTVENIIDGELCYVARKTKDGNPVTVKVPLSKIATEILERYKDNHRKPLLPYISEQKYNVAIKRMLTLAGITRNVLWRNPTTGETETRPINEIASSHMARRTFVGNLYSKVKDPNLVGKLSGHKEGSKAFSRYRDIDKNMREELINLID